ncbi:MAG TPA: hypothetical protein VIJ92_18365 [Ginsengibacter sp.]
MQSELMNEQTSLLSQIVNEVEKMNLEQKKKLLIKLKHEEILRKAKSLDSVSGLEKIKPMTDEEADEYISQQRKLRYEQSKT